MYDSTASRWAAVQSRDTRAASAFVYAVKTTGIFCRPNCPCRLARRANVQFFDTVAEARAAGFRACKRCQPEATSSMSAAEKLVSQACATIETQKGQLTLVGLAKQLSISPRYLHGVFLRIKGCTPAEYAGRVRQMVQESLRAEIPVDGLCGSGKPLGDDSTTCVELSQNENVVYPVWNWQELDFSCSPYSFNSKLISGTNEPAFDDFIDWEPFNVYG